MFWREERREAEEMSGKKKATLEEKFQLLRSVMKSNEVHRSCFLLLAICGLFLGQKR